MAELPGLGEGGQGSEVKGLMLADQFTLHFLRGTNGAGPPIKCGRTTRCLREQLRRAVACRLVAGEQDGRLTLPSFPSWKREKTEVKVLKKRQKTSIIN